MLKARTGDQALVREINLSIILNALRDQSPISRASLAAITGLNKTTVSSLVQQLIDAHFVSEIGADRTEDTGRPGILLKLNPKVGCIVGAEIGVDFISVIITDFAADVLWRYQEKSASYSSQERTIQRTLTIINEGIAATEGKCNAVLGLGLGVPGLVDGTSGTLLFAPNLQWQDVPLREILQAEFDFPVYVDNEANMATLGESYFGVARGSKSVLYVSAGVGLGGGIVLDGRILPGTAGFAGEVGHMTLIIDGRRCNCGNHGCWETLVSQEALFRRIREATGEGNASSLTRYLEAEGEGLTVPLIVDAARSGDLVTLKALEDTAYYLGVGLANLVNALNPEIVVFGGILSLGSDYLLPTLRRVIRERALRWSVDSMQVMVAAHGFDACVMGGIASVYYQILSQPFRPIRDRQRRDGTESLTWGEQQRALTTSN
ncbi:MAG: ROK family transcriptional regulator [Chloroflexota bacterium]